MTLPNESKCIVGGIRLDSGERSEQTRRAEYWLGVADKASGDESRVRPGGFVAKFQNGGNITLSHQEVSC